MNGIERIRSVFARVKGERAALITYLVAGYPTIRKSEALAWALRDAGADMLEIGIPFSDPVADGPILAKASHQALKNGATPRRALAMVRKLRDEGFEKPLLGMTYANLVQSRGPGAASGAWASAGLDGAIVADLPFDESEPFRRAFEDVGLATCNFASPTTPLEGWKARAQRSSGFLYVIAQMGTTGTSQALSRRNRDPTVAIGRVPSKMSAPVCAGFGLTSEKDVARLAHAGFDGVIVGSAIAARVASGRPIASFVAGLRRVASFHGGSAPLQVPRTPDPE